jgi:hypothetical protein
VACTGAISDEFFNNHTGTFIGDRTPHPKQWTGKEYDLVTFSFGGDDIGFESILTHCFDLQGCPSDAAVRAKITQLGTTGVYKGSLHIPSYPTFLKHVATSAVASGGNVVVMGYPELVEDPTLWPLALRASGHCQGTISTGTARLFRGWAGDLNATISASVAEANALPSNQRNGVHFTFVDPVTGQAANGISASDQNLYEPATGTRHELCSDGDKAWLNGYSKHLLSRSFHPTQAGETAMGKLADEVISKLTWPWTPPVSAATGAPCTASAIMQAVDTYASDHGLPSQQANGAPVCSDGWASLSTLETSNGQVLGPDVAIASMSAGTWTVVSLSEGYLCTSLPAAAVQALGSAADCIVPTATTTTTTATALPVLMTSGPDGSPFDGIEPAAIYFSGDATNVVTSISWSSWTATQASGTGTWIDEGCVPDCATGSQTPYQATIELSNPEGGIFTTLLETTSGPDGFSMTFTYPGPSTWISGAS